MLIRPILITSLIHFSPKVWENVLFDLGIQMHVAAWLTLFQVLVGTGSLNKADFNFTDTSQSFIHKRIEPRFAILTACTLLTGVPPRLSFLSLLSILDL